MIDRAAERVAPLVLACLLGVGGCGNTPEPEPDGARYELRGTIVAADRERGTVTIDHEPVADFMGAMTMPFNVRDEWVFGAAEPEASISATLVVRGVESWLEDVVVRKSASAGAAAAAVIPAPDVGADVPAIDLIDQSGVTASLGSYAGQMYAYTFIYTRCPLPDFCPRMSEHFDDVFEAVAADPGRYGDLRLLSISIDPEFDTPEVLYDYGLRYLEEDGAAGFDRWRFATSTPQGIFEIGQFSGIRFRPDGTELIHSLRTVLVDRDGHVLQTFIGNQWEPEELLAAATAAAGR